MYSAIHRAGVLHCDIEWRHVRMRGPDPASHRELDATFDPQNMVLIDFNLAEIHWEDIPQWQWAEATLVELGKVISLPRSRDAVRCEFEQEVERRHNLVLCGGGEELESGSRLDCDRGDRDAGVGTLEPGSSERPATNERSAGDAGGTPPPHTEGPNHPVVKRNGLETTSNAHPEHALPRSNNIGRSGRGAAVLQRLARLASGAGLRLKRHARDLGR